MVGVVKAAAQGAEAPEPEVKVKTGEFTPALVNDAALTRKTVALFKEALGMREFSRGGPMPGDVRWINLSVPGTSGDLLEFMVLASQPAVARQHIGFEVPDLQRTHKELLARGLTDRNKPFPAQIGRWIWFIRDPNNIRIEFMGEPVAKEGSK